MNNTTTNFFFFEKTLPRTCVWPLYIKFAHDPQIVRDEFVCMHKCLNKPYVAQVEELLLPDGWLFLSWELTDLRSLERFFQYATSHHLKKWTFIYIVKLKILKLKWKYFIVILWILIIIKSLTQFFFIILSWLWMISNSYCGKHGLWKMQTS